MKEDGEEQGSWEEKGADSIEYLAHERCEFDCVSVRVESIRRWARLLVWCVWFGVNWCVVLFRLATQRHTGTTHRCEVRAFQV